MNKLQPVPSLTLEASYKGVGLGITLDSGATVSFCRRDLVERLGVPVKPNGQLAVLADCKSKIRSLGEVDFVAVERSTGDALLRVRALVVEDLAVGCYGGQTLHLDNNIVDDIKPGDIFLHGG